MLHLMHGCVGEDASTGRGRSMVHPLSACTTRSHNSLHERSGNHALIALSLTPALFSPPFVPCGHVLRGTCPLSHPLVSMQSHSLQWNA